MGRGSRAGQNQTKKKQEPALLLAKRDWGSREEGRGELCEPQEHGMGPAMANSPQAATTAPYKLPHRCLNTGWQRGIAAQGGIGVS